MRLGWSCDEYPAELVPDEPAAHPVTTTTTAAITTDAAILIMSSSTEAQPPMLRHHQWLPMKAAAAHPQAAPVLAGVCMVSVLQRACAMIRC
jgi:hypothetical protein